MSGRSGQEFYAQKLQRARQVPEADRCPAVAAFVAAEELKGELIKSLPAQGSEPALTATPANQRQVALAFAQVALAHYLCPSPPVGFPDSIAWYLEFLPELDAVLHYQSSSDGSGGTGRPRAGVNDFDITAALLDSFVRVLVSRRLRGENNMMAVGEGVRLQTLLHHPDLRAAVDRQLALFEPPRLTAHQLRCAAAYEAGMAAVQLLVITDAVDMGRSQQMQLPRAMLNSQAANLQLSSQQKAHLRAAAQQSADLLLQLEPGNPKTVLLAAAVEQLHARLQEGVNWHLRGIQLARQHRSDYLLALFGLRMVNPVSGYWTAGVSRASAEAAVAAFAEVQPALHRCKRMLPLDWTSPLDSILPAATMTYTAIQQHLQLGAVSMTRESMQHAVAAMDEHGFPRCSFCGQQAVGLRLCSQCKQARYCSTECQRQAWRAVHKQECRPAGRG